MRILALVFTLLCAACTSKVYSDRPSSAVQTMSRESSIDSEGKRYIDALADAVRDAHRIVVTEQSSEDDLLDPVKQPQRPVNFIPTVYASRELDSRERAYLLAALGRVGSSAVYGEPACIFDPHHTITFYQGSKPASAMRICFACGQVEWTGNSATRPDALIPALRAVISRWGMSADRNWRAMALANSN